MGQGHGYIRLKKEYGQNFLRDDAVARAAVEAVALENANVLEIGPGDGFLTRHILAEPVKVVKAFEIDSEWAGRLRQTLRDKRLQVVCQNILDVDFAQFESDAPWVLLSNLPYHITFPILRRVQAYRHLFRAGVIMVQEEVAQKIVGTSGRSYGVISLFFQRYFLWKKLQKVPPTSFVPPPKVYSRLLLFEPRVQIEPIEKEEEFWQFIKVIFRQPRRTLRNNLRQAHYPIERLDDQLLSLRAQQLSMDDFVRLWRLFIA